MFFAKSTTNTQIFNRGADDSITERIELEAGGAPTPITKEQAVYFRTVEGVEVTENKTVVPLNVPLKSQE
jgi:hypothetical protein